MPSSIRRRSEPPGHLAALGLWLLLLAAAPVAPAAAPDTMSIDLMSGDAVQPLHGQWRVGDAKLQSVMFRAPGADGQPGPLPVPTQMLTPAAGAAEFDDSGWEPVRPEDLAQRRGNGRVSFAWYRFAFTVPDDVGGLATRGAEIALELRVDDYAEVWVDGELARAQGQQGGSVIAGWNALNRVIVTRAARPRQQITLAILGINGPISDAPPNYIFFREARLVFRAGGVAPVAVEPQEVNVAVERLSPEMDRIVPLNTKLYKLADGFEFTEGPVWSRTGEFLLFSDPNHNTIYRYTATGELSVYREHSGYEAADIGEYGQPGSNGLTYDPAGRLTINEHGRHRVSRIEPDGTVTVLADRYRGKRLNSPNDLVYRSDGALYFTDPPFGLPKFFDDPRRQLPFSGVYLWRNGRLTLLDRSFQGPNGIALSPDEKFLYVGNWDPTAKIVRRFAVRRDGTLGRGETFIDLTAQIPGDEALDGIKVDVQGHLYLSAPGGVWVFGADGRHLGTIHAPHPVHNFAWGGADGRTLYLCARSTLYRLPLLVAGVRP